MSLPGPLRLRLRGTISSGRTNSPATEEHASSQPKLQADHYLSMVFPVRTSCLEAEEKDLILNAITANSIKLVLMKIEFV